MDACINILMIPRIMKYRVFSLANKLDDTSCDLFSTKFKLISSYCLKIRWNIKCKICLEWCGYRFLSLANIQSLERHYASDPLDKRDSVYITWYTMQVYLTATSAAVVWRKHLSLTFSTFGLYCWDCGLQGAWLVSVCCSRYYTWFHWIHICWKPY